jgi:hypothetical protein
MVNVDLQKARCTITISVKGLSPPCSEISRQAPSKHQLLDVHQPYITEYNS